MESVSVKIFRANLTDYAERAVAGDQIVVRRHGKPMALLRAAGQSEQLKEIGFHQLRASMGRTLRAAKQGRRWLVTYRGTARLVLIPVPAGLLDEADDEEDMA